MIVDYIEGHRSRFGVVPICTVLSRHGMSIAPSTYYAVRARRRGDSSRRVSERDLLDAYLANAVLDCWRANRSVYGIRKMWHALRRGGHQVGRDRTARLMSVVAAQGACRGLDRGDLNPRLRRTQDGSAGAVGARAGAGAERRVVHARGLRWNGLLNRS